MSFFQSPIIIALIAGLPAFILGILAYTRARKVDEVTEQSGVVSQQVAGVNQVIEGLNRLILNLQEDNRLLRENVMALDLKLQKLNDEYELLRKEVLAMSKR